MGWVVHYEDVSAAFLQGKELPRTEKVYVRVPAGYPEEVAEFLLAGLEGGSRPDLVQLTKAGFGLPESPRLWYLEYKDTIEDLGLRELALVPGLFRAFHPDGTLRAMASVHVDDTRYAGDESSQVLWDALHQKLKFGKLRRATEGWPDGWQKFCGPWEKQCPTTCEMWVSMQEYVKSIPLARGRDEKTLPAANAKGSSTPTASGDDKVVIEMMHDQITGVHEEPELSPEERKLIGSIVGQLNWAARQGRYDLSFVSSMVQQLAGQGRAEALKWVNSAVRRAREGCDCVIRRFPCALDEMLIVSVSDAAYGAMPNGGSQGGTLVMIADPAILAGPGPVYIVEATSSKIQRVVRCSMSAEVSSLATAFEHGDYVRAVWAELVDHTFKLGQWKLSAAKWRHLLVTDAKTGYDAIASEVLPSDRKIAIDVGVLREGLLEPCSENYIRWVPGSEMPGDGLTKWAHNQVLTKVMCSGEWSLVDTPEAQELRRLAVVPEKFHGSAKMILGGIAFYKSLLPEWVKPEPVEDLVPVPLKAGVEAEWAIYNEPKGVCVNITPWNAPATISLANAISMLAAGNHVVIKPPELVPTVSAVLRRLCQRYLSGYVWVEEGGKEVVERLIDEGADHVSFTGGGEIAKIVAARCGQMLTPMTLELGGKSPAFVDAGLDEGMLRSIVQEILETKVFKTGQFCCAHDYERRFADLQLQMPSFADSQIRQTKLTLNLKHMIRIGQINCARRISRSRLRFAIVGLWFGVNDFILYFVGTWKLQRTVDSFSSFDDLVMTTSPDGGPVGCGGGCRWGTSGSDGHPAFPRYGLDTAAAEFPDTPTPEPEALARKQRLVLDKAYRYLLDQGFGVLELASPDLDEVPAMARQLADELAIPLGDWLEDALYCWLQEAQQEAKTHRRVRGYLQDDLTWMTLMPPTVLPTKEGAGRGPRYAPEAPLLDGSATGTLKGSLDPDRAALLLVGGRVLCLSLIPVYSADEHICRISQIRA
ncbi:Fatty aldehyde dehydrogenase [Symbiodinium microadriaticum]|uniref:Fatty aldehyde dehydrogenase n=1 Tax=Symbiodinium microadriaticum TaxID=2951 RepID=A0A1Q9C4B9_SYMMI|nr:Fatty aldehyde dehydrogenase [Symbiodinium microadriaticum]